MKIRIHAIQTGTVRVRPMQVYGGNILKRYYQILLSKNWADWMPIYCWLIEHPDGLIMIDAGETSQINQEGYLPSDFLYHRVVQTRIAREDEVDAQLEKLGFDKNDVQLVILTHLHGDHIGGIGHFSNAKSMVSRVEYDLANSAKGPKLGYFNHHWPQSFKPDLIDFDHPAEGAFDSSYRVNENILLVPTPGHTPGHLSVIIKDAKIVISGDATYNYDTLQKAIPDFVLPNKEGHESVKKLRSYINENNFKMLSSHDYRAVDILKNLA